MAWMAHRHLLRELVARDLSSRYRGSVFGLAWTLVTPLLMLAVYALVFGEILRVRWLPQGQESRGEFALLMFCGLLVYNFFADCLARAPMLVVGHANYVKKVVFPLPLLPLSAVLVSALQMLAAVIILLAFGLLVRGSVPLTSLLFPLVIVPVLGHALGLAWFFSTLGAYVRDLPQVVTPILSGLIFLSPVFYPVSLIPERWRFLLELNPLTIPIEQARQVLIFGVQPDWGNWGVACLCSLVSVVLGYAWFAKTRMGLSDVL